MNFGEPIEDPKIWRAGEEETPEYPPEEEAYEPDQDTPPIAKTHEEVLQNLQHDGEDQNFLEREGKKAGVDYDDHYDVMEPKIISNQE